MARIVDRAKNNHEGTLYGSTEEAERALDSMVETFKNRGHSIEVKRFDDEAYPLYIVKDQNDQWLGTYTIEL
jgi:hypothetical protein